MKSRLFFVLSLFVLVFTFSASSADLFSLVPHDASIVMKVQFQRILGQPDLKALFSTTLPAFETSYLGVFEKAGINPLEDIYNIVLFIDKDNRVGVLADGGFDAIVTCELAQSDPEIANNFTLTAVGGLPALKSELNETANVVFVDQRTMAIGDVAVLELIGKMAVDKKIRSIKDNAMFSFMERKLVVDYPQLWGVGISGRQWLPEVEVESSGLENVRATYFSVNYDEEFTLDATCLVTRNSQLDDLVDSLWDLTDALKVYVSTVDGMSDIMDNLIVRDDGENLAGLFLTMPMEKFNAALSIIGAQVIK